MTNTTTNIPRAVNFYYDSIMLMRAEARLLHGTFAQTRPVPSNRSLDSIKFRRYDNLAVATTALVEGQNPASVNFVVTDVTVQVQEYGNYVEISSTLEWTTPELNEQTEWSSVLGYNAGDTLDIIMRDAYNAGTSVSYGGNATLRTNVDSTDLIDATVIKKAVRILKNNNAKHITSFSKTDRDVDTFNVRPCFVAIVHPNITYTLKGLTGWLDMEQYAHTTEMMPGEVGKLDEIRFIESTNAKVFAGVGTGGIDVYSTLVFAQDAVARTMITGNGLEMIYNAAGSAGSLDPLKRLATMGWFTTFAAVILNNAFLTRIESAAAA